MGSFEMQPIGCKCKPQPSTYRGLDELIGVGGGSADSERGRGSGVASDDGDGSLAKRLTLHPLCLARTGAVLNRKALFSLFLSLCSPRSSQLMGGPRRETKQSL
ncbi:hypothetical protein Dimus_026001 [Dionaea muscipula]